MRAIMTRWGRPGRRMCMKTSTSRSSGRCHLHRCQGATRQPPVRRKQGTQHTSICPSARHSRSSNQEASSPTVALPSLPASSPPTVAPWTPTTTPATRPTCPPARPPPPPPSPPPPSWTLQQSSWLLETPGEAPAPCLLLLAREGGIPQTGSSSVHQVLSDGTVARIPRAQSSC